MQPDPLSPQQEDNQPEPLPAREMMPSAPLPVSEQIHLELTPAQEIIKLETSPLQHKSRSKLNIAAVVLGILAFFLLVATAGLGYWGYTLNTRLATAQQQLATLQGDHDKLQADYTALTSDKEKLNTDLTQAKADLEKANADLTAIQADLKKSQDQNNDLNAKIDKASKYTEILYKWFNSSGTAADIFEVNSQIQATKDQQLISMWGKLAASPSEDKFGEFILYLVKALRLGLQ